ncbi:MAG: phosphatidate cytidylyltransferase [Clostridia bacterium]|nr:phosphatidate cytidylyltransferase [Clostridia bacterium]
MKTRVLSGVCIFIFLVLLILTSGIPFVLNTIMAVVAAAGIYEILKVGELSSKKTLTAGAMIFGAAFVFYSDPSFPFYRGILNVATFLLILLAFTYYMKNYNSTTLPDLAFGLMMTLLAAYFFSAVVLTRRTEQGFWNLVMIFLLSWIPDTGAYFCGFLFGKHKLAPIISPKKTIEGAVGGLAVCVGISYLYAYLVGFTGANVNYGIVAVYAILGTLISIVGDLSASLIKRHYNVKDYGNLIPGHGGIMDRFDSIWFVAPFVYLMVMICPIFG